jgi:nicotinate-nucleotide adenylyltransferase
MARYWLNETDLNTVWLVVSPQNPHKSLEELAPAPHRLGMVRAATEGDPTIRACSVEFELPRPSYTIQTLRHLVETHPEMEWVLLVGADTAAQIPRWREGETLLHTWPVWVYPRRDASWEVVPKVPLLRCFPEAPRMDLSATRIRQYIQAGHSIRYLVPPPVETYIYTHGLYRA